MVRIDKIISVTAGRFHCWVESPVGIIRKPNAAVPQDLWDIFEGRKEVPKIKVADIKRLPGGNKTMRDGKAKSKSGIGRMPI